MLPICFNICYNQGEVGKHLEIKTKFEHFLEKYNSKKINYSPEKDDWKEI